MMFRPSSVTCRAEARLAYVRPGLNNKQLPELAPTISHCTLIRYCGWGVFSAWPRRNVAVSSHHFINIDENGKNVLKETSSEGVSWNSSFNFFPPQIF